MDFKKLKQILIGKPIETIRETKERVSRVTGLAVFASDALSSVAYATEEILLILIIGGAAALSYSVPITAVIIILAFIVIFSYRQTIRAYPKGAGAYLVSKDNLGKTMSLTAGAALLLDYILTVSVSISAGTAAVTSAVPSLFNFKVIISLFFIWLIVLINLRGTKEAGRIFAVPVYLFIVSVGFMIVAGLRNMFLGIPASPHLFFETGALPALSFFLIIRAFSSGCVALTGIEAISDGVGAFKEPEHINARAALIWLGILMAFLFGGIAILANYYGISPNAQETVMSQIGKNVFGVNWMYFLIQVMTMAILVLAANTSFNDFPRLLYFLARDKFAPRQFLNKGTKLAFSNGIIVLALFSSLLVIIFQANTHALIPLYAVGVFLCFTISQFSMVKHWLRLKSKGYRVKSAINLFGAISTFLVLITLAAMKFIHGAWVVIIIIPFLVKLFLKIKEHYDLVAKQLVEGNIDESVSGEKTVILLVAGVHQGTKLAYQSALNLEPKRLFALHIGFSKQELEMRQKQWQENFKDIPLDIIESPYRDITGPILEYVDEIDKKWENDSIIIVIPEFIPAKFWHNFLHNQAASRIEYAFRHKSHVQILKVPFRLKY